MTSMPDTKPTEPKLSRYRGLKPYQPGQSGNPAGRQKGSRNKLTEDFIADLQADWVQHGKSVIEAVRDERPVDYLKVVAGVITKDVTVTVRDYDDLSDEELARQFARVSAELAGSYGFGQREAKAGRSKALPN